MCEEEDVVRCNHSSIHPHICDSATYWEGKRKSEPVHKPQVAQNSSAREDSSYGQIYQYTCFSRPVQASSEEA